MAVTVLQQPSEVDLAYGPVIVTLSNIDPAADKYAIRIMDSGNNQVGFVTQSPNEVNRAQFDIRKIVQTLPKAGTAYDESFGSRTTNKPFRVGGPEIAEYRILAGVEVNGIFGDFDSDGEFVPNDPVNVGVFVIMNGTKMYYARDWYNIDSQYLAEWSADATGCTTKPEIQASRALTDAASNAYFTSSINNLPPGWPTPLYYEQGYLYCNVQYDRSMPWQVSWLSKQNIDEEGAAPTTALKGIEAVEIQEFDINQNLLTRTWIPNIIANGGGPNVDPGDGQAISFPYTVLNMQCGYTDLNGVSYTDFDNNAQTFNFNTDTHFYYLIPRVADSPQGGCSLGMGGNPLAPYAARRSYGFYINKGNTCTISGQNTDVAVQNKLQFKNLTSAYGTTRNNAAAIWKAGQAEDPLKGWTLFSWMNSFGYRDYWYFFGERAIKVRTKRETYDRSHNDFNGPLWDVEADARGITQFAGEQELEITVKSGYMPFTYWTQLVGEQQDYNSALMQSLFTSPDVRVWMHDHAALDYVTDSKKMHYNLPETWNKWEPVVITNKDYEFKKNLREGKLYNYEVSFKMANKQAKQSGEHA